MTSWQARVACALAVVLGPALAFARAPAPRPWLEKSVLYGVIPARFGGARAVTAHLDRLKALGVDALWLSPIYATPEGDFGYAVTDFRRLRPDFGRPRDLRRLVDEAHRRGLRVILDFVPNHTSVRHPWFERAKAGGPASATWDFYDRDEHGQPTSYFGWTHLPNLNYGNPKVRRAIVSAMAFWVREFDVDGFRLDVAWGVRQRRPGFWREAKAALRRVKPDVAFLAEASGRDPYYPRNGFEAAYDWTDQLGEWAWKGVFDEPARIVPRLHAALTNDGKGYPRAAHLLRFLDNNDTGKRFVSVHGVPLTRAAAALLLTLPGTPLVYNGDEVGAEFEPYADAGRRISWDDPHRLEPWYRRLIALRKAIPALSGRGFRALPFGEGQTTYAYLRWARRDHPVVVAVNFGAAETRSLEAPGPASSWRDAVDGSRYQRGADGTLTVTVPDHGVRVLVPVR